MTFDATLNGMTALVTGGAKRLGADIARALAGAGMNVVIHCRSSRAEAENLAEELLGMDVLAWTVQADLEDPTEAEGLIEDARAQAGRMDVLVNNASIFPECRLEDVQAADIAASVSVNAVAPLLIAREFAAQPELDAEGREGAIVNLLDCRIVDYDKEHVAYHLSKRMLYSLTKMMAIEYAPAIRVNGVAPGLILPPEGKDEEYLRSLAHTNPLNRHGAPSDITDAVLYLVRSRFVTGQVLYVDGGRHLHGAMYG